MNCVVSRSDMNAYNMMTQTYPDICPLKCTKIDFIEQLKKEIDYTNYMNSWYINMLNVFQSIGDDYNTDIAAKIMFARTYDKFVYSNGSLYGYVDRWERCSDNNRIHDYIIT